MTKLNSSGEFISSGMCIHIGMWVIVWGGENDIKEQKCDGLRDKSVVNIILFQLKINVTFKLYKIKK